MGVIKFIDILRGHLDAFNQAYSIQIIISMRQLLILCSINALIVKEPATESCLRSPIQPSFYSHKGISVDRSVSTMPSETGH